MKKKPQKGDTVTIDGKWVGHVVQDGVNKSLVSTKRSDGEHGSEQDWYDNDRLRVVKKKQL